MKLHFFGAAGGEVTGSKHLLETPRARVLLDAGFFQGKRAVADAKNRRLPFSAKNLDAVIISHAHLDHIGALPLLIKKGFASKVHCTKQTADLLPVMLRDAAAVFRADGRFFRKNPRRRARTRVPLEPPYSNADVEKLIHHITPHALHKRFAVAPGITGEFFEAGHILGSAQVLLRCEDSGKTIGFTGDVGRRGRNLIPDPEPLPACDLAISEATYGGRSHPANTDNRAELACAVRETAARGGKIFIPAFALERTQELLYDLHLLRTRGEIPPIPIFLDSPLAAECTRVFERHAQSFDSQTRADFGQQLPTRFSGLQICKTALESKRLNTLLGPAVILAGSGMCEGGRIRHHLRNGLADPKNTVLFVGYQPQETLGNRIARGDHSVKIFDEMYAVHARIQMISGYSGHGDQADLLKNLENAARANAHICLVHGEASARQALADALQKKFPKLRVSLPTEGEGVEV